MCRTRAARHDPRRLTAAAQTLFLAFLATWHVSRAGVLPVTLLSWRLPERPELNWDVQRPLLRIDHASLPHCVVAPLCCAVQLYVSGEFVGGADIAEQMFNSGELQQVLRATQQAAAK